MTRAGMSFKLKYQIPNLELTIENETQVIKAMTREVFKLIKRRTLSGLDSSHKPFPAPKDGGASLEETGQLKRSIGFKVKKKGGKISKKTGKTSRVSVVGLVLAKGKRDLSKEDVSARRKRAKESTRRLRAEAQAAFDRGIVSEKAYVSKKTGKLRVGRVRRHAILTNAALAGVLSTEPQDPSGKAGGRKKYRIFEASSAEIDKATSILQTRGRFQLKALRGRFKLRPL